MYIELYSWMLNVYSKEKTCRGIFRVNAHTKFSSKIDLLTSPGFTYIGKDAKHLLLDHTIDHSLKLLQLLIKHLNLFAKSICNTLVLFVSFLKLFDCLLVWVNLSLLQSVLCFPELSICLTQFFFLSRESFLNICFVLLVFLFVLCTILSFYFRTFLWAVCNFSHFLYFLQALGSLFNCLFARLGTWIDQFRLRIQVL